MYNIKKVIGGFILMMFCTLFAFSQTSTNSAVLYGTFTQSNSHTATVPIPVEIVRTNGLILELRLNISNVAQLATNLNLRVYELLYTTNVVETPVTNNNSSGTTSGGTVTGGSTSGGSSTEGSTTGDSTSGGSTTGGSTTGGSTTGGSTSGGSTTGGSTTGGSTSTSTTNSIVYVTNSVTINVTMQTSTGITNEINLPAKTIWTENKLQNIIFDINNLPADAIILRFRILDYIYDENGNLVGPQGTSTNSGGSGTGGSGTGGSGTGSEGNGTVSPPPPPTDSVMFPIEVLGADQHTEQFKLVLNDDVSKLHGLRLKVHGLTYTNKMSISVNDSPWIMLNNTNVDIPSKWDRAMYGMNKNHGTITFVVPFAPNNIAKTSINDIKVKFNDIDKETVGYRILDADLVKSEPNGYEAKVNYNQRYQPNIGINTNWVNKYIPLTLTTVKTQDDPKNWIPLSLDTSVINRGKDIWFNGNITEKGLPIKAKCTDCHTTDGYDLKYFNYSDKSIIARSRYHGLNEDDSESIAAYIRSLNVPYQEKGRPWNPPYQPGPGLDSKPISSWSAGAGLEAVAENDLDTLKALFPNGFKNGIKYDDGVSPIDFKKSLNLREIPLVIQLPDWNRWLPRAHLKDVAPELWDYFEKTNGYKVFTWQRSVAMSPPTSNPAQFLVMNYRGFDEKYAYARIQADQGGVYNLYIENTTNTWANVKIRDVINPSYSHSITVKHWEILNKFGLQDLGHAVFDPNLKDSHGNQGHYIMGNKPESFFVSKGVDYKKVIQKRRWFDTYTFHLAPHIGGETGLNGRSIWGPQSFQWYQLQMILDDTNRNPDRNTVDWGYLLAFQNATLDHQNGDNHLYTIFSHSIALMNQIKASEAFEFQIGNPINTGPLEGRYFAYKPSSYQFISDGVPWQHGFDFDHRWAGWAVKYAPGFANNAEYFSAVKDVASAWYEAEISKFHEIDPQYLKDTGLNEEYLNLAEAGLRYIGGDDNVINKIVTLRNKVWPNNAYVNKITKFYPQPYPQWNPGTISGGTGTGGSNTNPGTGGSGTGTGGGTINPTPPSTDAVQFPVEVLGADQHTEEFKLVINDNLNDIYGIQFTAHALTYTNKALISVNNSPWIPLNNRTVIFPRKFERLWTGIGSIQNVLTMVLPFASNNIIPSVTNTIKFKFNDITKASVGYRILNADIVRRQQTSDTEKTFAHGWDQPSPYKPTFITNTVYNYLPVTLATVKTFDNPKNWSPASSNTAIINQGKDLWFNGNISERGVALKAKCSDCHFIDGYDLKYFNYSDKSIVARSKYHGLSEQQGLALASYIRSLDVPYQEKGRPWNPLYQPGPGMSKVPIDNWVAGAGMEWVLDDDIKSFKYIFPNGTQNGIVYNDVVQPIDFKKAYNINDIPIAMQLPDWNHWLPKVHLKDSAPEIWDWSATKDGGSGRRFFDWFMGSIPKDQGMKGLVQILRSHGEETGYQLVHMDQFFQKKYFDAGKQIQYMNDIRMAYRHWVTVRTLEIMQRWKMQDLGHDILEDNANTRDQWGERGARSYIDLAKLDKIKAQFGSSYTNVFNDRRWFANTWPFHLAPHIGNLIAVTDQSNPNFTYEPYGDQSSQWYQLQMYLDDSNRMPEYNIIDWGYLHNILYSFVSQWGASVPYALYTGKHTALQFMNSLKSYEAFAYNGDYKGLLEGQWSDEHTCIRLLGGTVLIGSADSSKYGHYQEFTGHFIDAYGTKERRDMMVGVFNQLFKAQLDRLIEHPSAARFDMTVSSENMLRYMGGDSNLIQQFVDFRNKTWPNNGYVSKITHVWPQPFYPAFN